MRKRNLSILTLLLIVAFSFLLIQETRAGYNDNVFGWAWVDNIGWISMNCTNQSASLATTSVPIVPGELHGWAWSDNIGWISLNCDNDPGCNPATEDYNVRINFDNTVSGYAWSDNLGWLSFYAADTAGCPFGPCPATYNSSSKEFSGWARFLNYDGWDGFVRLSDGWEGMHIIGENEITGWAWGSDVVGWITFRSGCAVDYGINIDTSTGKLEGYAWARGTANNPDGVGWIKFDPTPGYPSGETPTYSACINLPLVSGEACEIAGYATNTVSGWARVVSASSSPTEAGGWAGWIKLRGTVQGTTTEYGVYLSGTEFKGWAWGGNPTDATNKGVLGWISFNCENCEGACDSYPTCGDPAHPDYKVWTTFTANQDPIVKNQRIDYETYCRVEPTRAKIGFHWEYEDPDNDPEAKFEFQIDDNAAFSSPEVNRKFCNPEYPNNDQVVFVDPSPSGSVTYGAECLEGPTTSTPDKLTYNPAGTVTYHWRVRVWDDQGKNSGWISGSDFTTEPHAYPWCAWTYTPAQLPGVSVDEVVNTINNAICYDINNNTVACKSYYWGIPNPPIDSEFATGTATSFEPQIIFHSIGDKIVTSTVTDFDNNSCACPRTIPVSLPLPEWREVAPISLPQQEPLVGFPRNFSLQNLVGFIQKFF